MPPKSNLSTLIRGIQGTPLKITDQGIAGVFLSNATSSGLATENTAISILNAIVASNQDVEVLLVRDAGAGNIVIKQVRDYVGGITTYEDVNGNSYVPVGPLEYLDPSAVLNLILTELQAQGLTLNDIDTNTDGLEALLTTIDADTSNLDVPLSTIAKEATLELIRLLLVSLDGKDFATELTLSGIKTQTDLLNFIATALEVNVTSSVLPTGAATEATLGTLATEASLGAIKVAVGTDGVIHGAAQKGIRALGTDGTNDQQISTDVDGKVNVLVQNPSPIPVSGTVTVNQPVSVDDNGGSLTVDATDLDIRDLAFATDKVDASGSTVALDTPTLLALESVTVQNAGLANAVNIQDGGNSITIDNSNLDTALAPATRTHNTVSATGVGSVPAGSMCGSVINAGSAVGTWNGISLPAGISIPWTQIGPRDTYGAIAYDATGTTFIIEYTT